MFTLEDFLHHIAWSFSLLIPGGVQACMYHTYFDFDFDTGPRGFSFVSSKELGTQSTTLKRTRQGGRLLMESGFEPASSRSRVQYHNQWLYNGNVYASGALVKSR